MEEKLTFNSENNYGSDLRGKSIFQRYLIFVSGLASDRRGMWSSAPVLYPFPSWAQWEGGFPIRYPSTIHNWAAIRAEGKQVGWTAC